MNERHGPLVMLGIARRDAARSQITLGTLVFTGGCSVVECGRLNRPSWLLGALQLLYLFTYSLCIYDNFRSLSFLSESDAFSTLR